MVIGVMFTNLAIVWGPSFYTRLCTAGGYGGKIVGTNGPNKILPVLSTTKTQNTKRTFWNARSERRGGIVVLWIPEASQSFFCSLQKGSAVSHRIFQQCFKVFLDLCS